MKLYKRRFGGQSYLQVLGSLWEVVPFVCGLKTSTGSNKRLLKPLPIPDGKF